MLRQARSAVLTALSVVMSMALLTGCSSGTEPSLPSATVNAPLDGAGPWKDDFRDALASGVSEYEQRVLADGMVTAAEVEEAHSRVERCLSDSGLTITYSKDGGFDLGSVTGKYPVDFFERSDPVLRSCEKRSDEYITMLFEETRRNPEKQDEAKITVACLRKAGLVSRTYTERTWRSENDTGVWSFKEFDPAAVQCRLDPLGLWREQ